MIRKINITGKNRSQNRFDPEKVKGIGNELAVALAVLFHFINGAIGINGISYITILIVWGLFVLNILTRNSKIYFGIVNVIIYISLAFAVSFAVVSNTMYTLNYALFFCGFGIVSMMVGCQEINIKKTLLCVNFIGVVGICLFLVRGIDASDTGYTMGISYSMLPLLLASVVLWIIDAERRMLASANFILLMIVLMKIAPRGIWICVLFFAFVIGFYVIVNQKDKNRYMLKIILLMIIAALVALLVLHMNEIILEVNSFVKTKLGLRIYALDKFAMYARKNNLMNGREFLWETAGTLIKESPMLGGGIGNYELFAFGSHSHNIILQVMCEAGLLFLVPTILFILEVLKILLIRTNRLSRERYLFLLMTCSCGLIPLFYSSAHWIWIPFWVFLGNLLGESQKVRAKEKINKSQNRRLYRLTSRVSQGKNRAGMANDEERGKGNAQNLSNI